MLALALSLLLQAAPDPLAASTFGHAWAGAETVWTTGAEKRTLAVGWVEGQLGMGRFAVSGTVGALGMVGKFEPGTPDTYTALRLQGAAHFNAFRAGSDQAFATCGPAVALEGGVPLDQTAPLPKQEHSLTAGFGLACSGFGWSTFQVVGADEQFTGWALMGRTHVPMSDRVAWVIRDSLGGQRRFSIKLDVVVRVW